ncbi:DUF3795 domain-containing protein [[Eubacterium] cellulosolvens]
MGLNSSLLEDKLVALCGMNCRICSGYLAFNHDVKSKGIRMLYCIGCRPRNKRCAFLKKRCSLLLENKVEYCYECADFPCTRLQRIDQRYRTFYRMSLIENLEFIKENGLTDFLKREEEKWKCAKCGGVVCCHKGICFTCRLNELKNKRKLYRWTDAEK